MDNAVFNVNGYGREMLVQAIKLLFLQRGFNERSSVSSWSVDNERGIILYWHNAGKDSTPFPVKLSAEGAASAVWDWLQSAAADDIQLKGWDKDADLDGSTSKGWRVYSEDWGHVGRDAYAICAITPAYMWHGK